MENQGVGCADEFQSSPKGIPQFSTFNFQFFIPQEMWNVQNNLWTFLPGRNAAWALLKSSYFPTPGCGGIPVAPLGPLELIHITSY